MRTIKRLSPFWNVMTLELMEALIISTTKKEKVIKINPIILRSYKAALYNIVTFKSPQFQIRVKYCSINMKGKSKISNRLNSNKDGNLLKKPIKNYPMTIKISILILIQLIFSRALIKWKLFLKLWWEINLNLNKR